MRGVLRQPIEAEAERCLGRNVRREPAVAAVAREERRIAGVLPPARAVLASAADVADHS